MDPENDPALLLEPKLLVLFVSLYETRSVTRTAERLGQSQPNISLWLARLRELLGDPVFVRTQGEMHPTVRAELLVESVRETLRRLRQLSAPAGEFEPTKGTRVFRISMADGSHIALLPRLLRAVRDSAPLVRLEISPIDSSTTAQLQSGPLDLGIGVTAELQDDMYQQTFYEQSFICLLSQETAQRREVLSLADYLQASHVAISAGMSSELLDKALKIQRVQRRVVLRLPGFLGLASIVAGTDLIATVPRQIGEVLAKGAGLRILPCPVVVPAFTVKQFWHMRMHHDSAHRWLRSLCAATLTV